MLLSLYNVPFTPSNRGNNVVLTASKQPAKTVNPFAWSCFATACPNPLSQPVISTAFPATCAREANSLEGVDTFCDSMSYDCCRRPLKLQHIATVQLAAPRAVLAVV